YRDRQLRCHSGHGDLSRAASKAGQRSQQRRNCQRRRGLRPPNGSAIVLGNALLTVHRDLILKLITRYKLPAIYPDRFVVANGGLISYGPGFADQFRRAAGYVDRILKGEKPSDLPVQAPTKYELVINLKTAKALGLTVPQSLLARADE